jgi:hypothetical protein
MADIVASISQFSAQFKLKRVTTELVDKDPQRESLAVRFFGVDMAGMEAENRRIFRFVIST